MASFQLSRVPPYGFVQLPKVNEDDYPVLAKATYPHLPPTYAEWLALCVELERPHRYNVFYVDFNPTNFIEYMTNAGRKLDLETLIEFVNFNPWYEPD